MAMDAFNMFDPTIPAAKEPIDYVPRPRKLEGLRVGLVENTKYRSRDLLLMIAERLKQKHHMEMTLIHTKKSAGSPVEDQAIAEFKEKADFVVAGIGD